MTRATKIQIDLQAIRRLSKKEREKAVRELADKIARLFVRP